MEENKKQSMVEVLDISRVKNVQEMFIKPNNVLIKIINNSTSGLILPNGVGTSIIKYVIAKVGSNTNQFEVGDIVINLDFSGADFISHNDDKYLLVDYYNIRIAVKPDNYIA